MNIFYLDRDPSTCAKMHCDKHVVKMILETAQLLCTTHWLTGSEAHYRATHKNHPSTVWVRQSIYNYRWLCKLGVELCYEYTARYGKTHKSQAVIEWCVDNEPSIPNNVPFTDPPLAMPEACKLPDAVDAYRNYYIIEKAYMATWKRNKPDWFKIEV